MEHPGWYRWEGDTLILNVQVQPRASKDEIVGPHGDFLKVRTTAPPTEGQANARLIAFLAKTFKVPKSQVVLDAGGSARQKRFRIQSPRQLPSGIHLP